MNHPYDTIQILTFYKEKDTFKSRIIYSNITQFLIKQTTIHTITLIQLYNRNHLFSLTICMLLKIMQYFTMYKSDKITHIQPMQNLTSKSQRKLSTMEKHHESNLKTVNK